METIYQWLIGTGVFVAISAFIRFVPKHKLMTVAGRFMFGVGKAVSNFGNSKIGKAAMNKIEEGIFITLVAIFIHACNEFSRGLQDDNQRSAKKKK
jgi:hypothetical protein